MKKRLFVGLPLSKEVVRTCRNIRNSVQERQVFSPEDIRWVADRNLHVTLCFLGGVDEVLVTPIRDALSSVTAAVPAFSLDFKSISLAPPGKDPRMIWAVFGKCAVFEEFVTRTGHALAVYLQNTSGQHAKLPDHREIIPHATLARFKSHVPAHTLPQPETSCVMTVTSCCLYESHMTPSGAHYTTIGTVPLRGHY